MRSQIKFRPQIPSINKAPLKYKILKMLEFHSLLLENFEKNQKHLKMQLYACGNKAGKLLAHQIKGHQSKTHPFSLSPYF